MICKNCDHWTPWAWIGNIQQGFCRKHHKPWLAHGACDSYRRKEEEEDEKVS